MLGVLIFSKYFYLASLSSYYTFYLISRFGVSVQSAQLHLFVFLGAVGGRHDSRRADRRSHRPEVRDLGIDPRRLSVHLRAAVRQPVLDRHPDGGDRPDPRVGVLGDPGLRAGARAGTGRARSAGIFFGFAFGMGGLGAAALGRLADATSIEYVYRLCAYLPLIGLLTAFLPDLDQPATARAPAAPVR